MSQHTHIMAWIASFLLLITIVLLGYLSATYITDGQGITPYIGVPGMFFCLILIWFTTKLADETQ